MADFNFVTNRLATGAQVNEGDVPLIVAAGITLVIDLQSERDDSSLFVNYQIDYLWNGTEDDGKPKLPEWFQRSVEKALAHLATPHHRVLAHCGAGINRGPSTAYAILCAQGLPFDEAERLIRIVRPQVGLRYKADADKAIAELGYD